MSAFSKTLLRWHPAHRRNMPWVGESDPYKVWLSEIILQQTRVEQGTAYYLRFIDKYPTIKHLAKAPSGEVMKLWEGLGYYSRARNMHATAIAITNNYKGIFPSEYNDLIALKGIGKYTAHAILSYAFKQPYAVTDGNVLRILSRYAGIYEPVNSPEGKQQIEVLAQKLLDPEVPHLCNQAMMDFGATVCTPKSPDCQNCPFKRSCHAYKHDAVKLLPVKEKKKAPRERFFHFFVMRHRGKILIMPRHDADIWKQLWQFPLIEADALLSIQDLSRTNVYKEWKPGKVKWKEAATLKQQLTHQKLTCLFFVGDVTGEVEVDGAQQWVDHRKIKTYAFPGVIRDFMAGNEYF